MWDDMSPFIVGAGPTAAVLDPDLNPNNILQASLGGSIRVKWSFTGPGIWVIDHAQFTVTVYADPVSPGSNMVLGTVNPPLSNGPFSVNIPIAPNSLGPGAYRLTTLITARDATTGTPTNLAGFVDGPIIQVYA